MVRAWIVACALLSSGCYYEQRHVTDRHVQVWACEENFQGTGRPACALVGEVRW